MSALTAMGLSAIVLAIALSLPAFRVLNVVHTSMLAVHLLLELFAVVVSVLVVITIWHTLGAGAPRHYRFAIAGFALVAIVDVAHALTYDGMPPFLADASTPRAIFFWLAARTAAVITLLVLATESGPSLSRAACLACGIAAAVAVLWLGSFHLDVFPETFAPGEGVTRFKSGFEYGLSALNLLAAAVFWRRATPDNACRFLPLAAASFVMAMGHIVFSHYETPSDFRNFFGHLFKVASYVLIYRAVFLASLRAPYEQLRQTEQELRAGDERLRAMLRQISELRTAIDEHAIVAHTDARGVITEVNDKFCALSGYARDELVGQTYERLGSGRHPPEFYAELWATVTRGDVWQGEMGHRAKDGAEFWLATTIVPFCDESGRARGHVGIAADVTRRRRVEEALEREQALLKSIVENVPDMIIAKDLECRYSLMNPPARRLLRVRADEDPIGKTAYDYVDPESAREAEREDREVMATGRGLVNSDRRSRAAHAEGRRISLIKIPLPDAEGRIVGVVSIHRDVTDLHNAIEALGRANVELESRVRARTADLEAAMRELESFSYTVSHDLSGPVRRISAFTGVLAGSLADRLTDTERDFLARIERQADRMSRLIQDLLALSRIHARAFTPVTTDLAALAHEIVAELRAADPSRQVTFSAPAGLTAYADESLMRILLHNLIENAWKYTGRTPGAHIEVGRVEGPQGPAYFVKDNGVGFDMAHAADVFRPFHRLHSETDFPGTGIGLATVERIVRRHGGEVWAESVPGSGATFYFTLSEGGTAAVR